MAKKLYTVEQANRALPYVRRVVEDLVAEHRRWSDAVRELEVLAARERMGPAARERAERFGADAYADRVEPLLLAAARLPMTPA